MSRSQSSSDLAVKPLRLSVDHYITHYKPVNANASPSPPEETLPPEIVPYGPIYRCQVCDIRLHSMSNALDHARGKRHLRTVIYSQLKIKRKDLRKDKHSIEVTSKFEKSEKEKGIIELTLNLDKNEKGTIPITVTNKGTSPLYLNKAAFLRDHPFYKLTTERVPKPNEPVPIAPGNSMTVTVKVKLKRVGRYHSTLVLHFTRNEVRRDIHIIRDIRTRVTNQIVAESQPVRPYTPPPRVSIIPANYEVIEGEKPKSEYKDELERKLGLDSCFIPKLLRTAVNHGLPTSASQCKVEEVIKESRRVSAIGSEKPCFDHYHERLSLLLHLEELQMEVDIRHYDMKDVTMKRSGAKLLELKVPGLAENRPSVMRGDCIFVQPVHENKEYKGYVHKVQLDSVLLGFSKQLLATFIDNMKFNVRFTFNRLPLKLQHRATKLADEHGMKKLLFPHPDMVCKWGHIQDPDSRLVFYDANIGRNEEQATAVRHIVAGTSRPAPYLIFGPPGTGKTVTVVEAIKQIRRCIPSSHILACAPSNSAADLIAQRLVKHLPKADVFRMNAASRCWSDVPQDIREMCNYDNRKKDYYFPSKADICKKKIVITTLVTAGRLASANFPPNHFSHVFIDEAGYAFESEAVISIAGILETSKRISEDGGQLVLAGDPKQLGPIVRSPHAKAFGLDISLLERLMESSNPFKRKTEDQQHYDPRLITKLLDNYRSHPDILKLPNKLYYNGELRVCANEIVRESLCQWKELPKKGFPIIFHGIVGQDMREGNSPSYFNPEEVSVVFDYVEKLMTARGIMKLKETDIGVISPYRQQVVKIRQALKKRHYENIKVGSVEEFQGQERMVIIISAVRSNENYLEDDSIFKLGFLANPKKFNVAITRAKALMVVIGNPDILQHDDAWNSLLQYCIENNGYTGHEFEPIGDEIANITLALGMLRLELNVLTGKTPAVQSGQSEIQSQAHPAWREPEQI